MLAEKNILRTDIPRITGVSTDLIANLGKNDHVSMELWLKSVPPLIVILPTPQNRRTIKARRGNNEHLWNN